MVTILIAFLVFVFVWPLVDEFVAKGFRRWVIVLLFLVCAIPYFLWIVFFPPAFDFTVFAKKIDYEFRDEEYAYLFFAENEDEAEFVSID